MNKVNKKGIIIAIRQCACGDDCLNCNALKECKALWKVIMEAD